MKLEWKVSEMGTCKIPKAFFGCQAVFLGNGLRSCNHDHPGISVTVESTRRMSPQSLGSLFEVPPLETQEYGEVGYQQ